MYGNVSYKNSAAIASGDFPQENQTQQIRTDFRFDTKLALFLYIVAIRTFLTLTLLSTYQIPQILLQSDCAP